VAKSNCLIFLYHWIIHSRDSFRNADSSSNETSEVFIASHWIIHSNHFFK